MLSSHQEDELKEPNCLEQNGNPPSVLACPQRKIPRALAIVQHNTATSFRSVLSCIFSRGLVLDIVGMRTVLSFLKTPLMHEQSGKIKDSKTGKLQMYCVPLAHREVAFSWGSQ